MVRILTASDSIFQGGDKLLIGMQRVKGSDDRVLLWMKDTVQATTTLISGKRKYGKSLYKLTSVYTHLGRQLDSMGIKGMSVEDLFASKHKALWRTRRDGDREFIPLLIKDPISSANGLPFNIQVEQTTTPNKELYLRALIESEGDTALMHRLINKYVSKSRMQKYESVYIHQDGCVYKTKKLSDVYTHKDNRVVPVYEYSKVVLGFANHKIISSKPPKKKDYVQKGLLF